MRLGVPLYACSTRVHSYTIHCILNCWALGGYNIYMHTEHVGRKHVSKLSHRVDMHA